MMDRSRTETRKITVTVNGKKRQLTEESTVYDLLDEMDIDPELSGMAVAVDDAVVPRSAWETTMLEHGARVEVISATQGG